MNLRGMIVPLVVLTVSFAVVKPSLAQPYPQSGDHSACQFSDVNYGVEFTANSTYQWLLDSDDGGSGTITENSPNNTIGIHWDTPGTCALQLTETNATGCTVIVTINITVNPAPTPEITGVYEACKNTEETYEVQPVAGNTYLWEVTGGQIIGDPDNNTVTVNWNGDTGGSLTVTETIGECSAQDNESILINPLPLTSTIYHD